MNEAQAIAWCVKALVPDEFHLRLLAGLLLTEGLPEHRLAALAENAKSLIEPAQPISQVESDSSSREERDIAA